MTIPIFNLFARLVSPGKKTKNKMEKGEPGNLSYVRVYLAWCSHKKSTIV